MVYAKKGQKSINESTLLISKSHGTLKVLAPKSHTTLTSYSYIVHLPKIFRNFP